MFYSLLAVTFLIAAAVAWLCATLFSKPADAILRRVIQDEIYRSWLTYLKFSLYVVGISAGVRIRELEQYISPRAYSQQAEPLALTSERWTLEAYRTVIGSLQGIAWVLFAFFAIALVAYVILKLVEAWRGSRQA